MLGICRCSWVTSGVFAACLAFAAHGAPNVFDDAVFWFRGGKDLSNDHYMQQGEFFDDLHADDSGHANHKMSMVDYAKSYEGFEENAFRGNATIRDEQVVFPALGTNIVKNMQVLRISNSRKQSSSDSQYKYHPFVVNPRSVFANNHISNEYTIVSRIRLDDDGVNRNECFVRVGYDSSKRQGMWLGFMKTHPSHPGCMRVAAFRTPDSSSADTAWTSSLAIPTNTWVDLAIIVGNGRLRVGVAAPVSLSSHNNNPTIAFDQTTMWTDNCPVTTDGYRLFCFSGQTAPLAQSGADTTCFIGSVQQLAIWGKKLEDEDVMAAFGMPRPAIFRTGFDNDASNEFGTRSDASQTIDGLGSWQNIANTMKAGDTWTVNFTALRDEAELPQIFSIKSLDGSAAQIEPVLNGTSLGEGRIAANSRGFWPVAAGLVVKGENTLVITRKDGGTRDFRVDAMELGGSLGVGKMTYSSTDDERTSPTCTKTGVPSAADPNTQHWPQGLMPSTGVTNLHFRVWVDPEVAAKGKPSFTFITATRYNGSNSGDFFSIRINGVDKGKLSAQSGWKQQTLSSQLADLHGGWNDIEFICAADLSCYWDFACYQFNALLPESFGFSPAPGLAVIFR